MFNFRLTSILKGYLFYIISVYYKGMWNTCSSHKLCTTRFGRSTCPPSVYLSPVMGDMPSCMTYPLSMAALSNMWPKKFNHWIGQQGQVTDPVVDLFEPHVWEGCHWKGIRHTTWHVPHHRRKIHRRRAGTTTKSRGTELVRTAGISHSLIIHACQKLTSFDQVSKTKIGTSLQRVLVPVIWVVRIALRAWLTLFMDTNCWRYLPQP
jgi:hypothetical protein